MKVAFTLVELMIVVAIVMVLGAIAIPSFYEMQLQSKRAEAPPNVASIVDANIAYEAAHDLWHAGSAFGFPAGAPGKTARAWSTGNHFDTIEWRPDGPVRCSYYSVAVDTGQGPIAAWSQCDVDNAGPDSVYGTNDHVDEALHWFTGPDTF